MRMLEQRTEVIPANSTVFLVLVNQGIKSAYIRASSTAPGQRLIINDNASGYQHRIANMLIGAENLTNGNRVWTPLTGDLLVIQSLGAGVVTANITYYDEPVSPLQGQYFSDFRVVAIAASGTSTSASIDVGRFPNAAFTLQTDRDAQLHLDMSVDGITFIPDFLLGPTMGVAGATISGQAFIPGPTYRTRIINLDAVNVCNATIVVFHST